MMQKSCSNLVYVETFSALLEFFLCNRFFLVNKARTRSKHILMLKHKFHNNLAGIIFSPRKRQRVRFAQRKLFRYSTASFQLTKKKRRLPVKRSLYDPFVENAVTATESQLSRRSVSVRHQQQGSL